MSECGGYEEYKRKKKETGTVRQHDNRASFKFASIEFYSDQYHINAAHIILELIKRGGQKTIDTFQHRFRGILDPLSTSMAVAIPCLGRLAGSRGIGLLWGIQVCKIRN